MNKEFVSYEYKEIIANRDKISFLIDGLENFGWEIDDNPILDKGNYVLQNKVLIRMKRNRKIMNKAELTRLQRNFMACVKEIDMLEAAKTSKATMYALIAGIIGTAFMAGSVFAVVATPPVIWLCVLLAIPAFVGWLMPYFIYQKTVKEQTNRIGPLIEEKYDEIESICEKGYKLLI